MQWLRHKPELPSQSLTCDLCGVHFSGLVVPSTFTYLAECVPGLLLKVCAGRWHGPALTHVFAPPVCSYHVTCILIRWVAKLYVFYCNMKIGRALIGWTVAICRLVLLLECVIDQKLLPTNVINTVNQYVPEEFGTVRFCTCVRVRVFVFVCSQVKSYTPTQ